MFINKNKTYISNNKQKKEWYLINAKNKTLGRLSTEIAILLKGKNFIQYTPYQIPSTYIIVINSSYINVTGKKKQSIVYKKHSGRPGGLKEEKFMSLQKRLPNKIIEHSIKGMLPKNKLGRKLFTHLKIYSQDYHPHQAQKPIILN
uniref:Ribosomal protein L13 n=1 Tax=Compsothamnion thuioides TaxID=3097386 RepID=A0A4D6WSL3_9FLOR|nr:ribosomal protein L13 [Compsothamnion thuyoides]